MKMKGDINLMKIQPLNSNEHFITELLEIASEFDLPLNFSQWTTLNLILLGKLQLHISNKLSTNSNLNSDR